MPHCPEWDTAGLVLHTGGVLGWMAAIVSSGERVSRHLPPAPDDPAGLPSWYLANLERNAEVLGSADAGAETWTFSTGGDHRVTWWQRRVAVEVAVHRWDAEHPASVDGEAAPHPLAGDVAAEGIEE